MRAYDPESAKKNAVMLSHLLMLSRSWHGKARTRTATSWLVQSGPVNNIRRCGITRLRVNFFQIAIP
jgi:hypothetical protein